MLITFAFNIFSYLYCSWVIYFEMPVDISVHSLFLVGSFSYGFISPMCLLKLYTPFIVCILIFSNFY